MMKNKSGMNGLTTLRPFIPLLFFIMCILSKAVRCC